MYLYIHRFQDYPQMMYKQIHLFFPLDLIEKDIFTSSYQNIPIPV